jgi:spermidine/putrescine transport system ATP-binding protein
VGVRPEKLKVDAGEHAAATDGLNALSGTILDASYMGVSTQYLVQTGEGHRLTVYAQNLTTAGAGELLADGQQVQLTWKPQHTFVIGGQAEHVAGDPHVPEEEEGATVE